MAVAGKVAITPKGDWKNDVIYDSLCLVKFGSKLYVSKKNVPISTQPTDTEYWMFAGETDVSAIGDSIDKIIDGRTIVGKAWKDSDGNFINTTYVKVASLINSEDGVNGLRFWNEQLEYYDILTHEWVKIETGGGSVPTSFKITTTASDLSGKEISLYTDDDIKITSGTFSSNASGISCFLSADVNIGNYYVECEGFKYEFELMAKGTTKEINFDEAECFISFTVEGAMEDDVLVFAESDTTRSNQLAHIPFATNQTTGTCDNFKLTPITNGNTFVFVSNNVAKDTTNGTDDYSKNVNLTKLVTNVKCMPDGAIYWYGNNVKNLHLVSEVNDVKFSKNYFYRNTKNSQYKSTHYITDSFTIDTSKYSKFKSYLKVTNNTVPSGYGSGWCLFRFPVKGVESDIMIYQNNITIKDYSINTTSLNKSSSYGNSGVISFTSFEIYFECKAFWLE